MIRFSSLLWLFPFFSFLCGYSLLSYLQRNKTVITPTLVGQPLEKAIVTLCQHNLNVRIIGYKEDPELAQGTIISQSPTAGKIIKENQTLYVVIAQKPTALKMPNLYHKSLKEVMPHLENIHASVKTYSLPADNCSDICIAQSPSANTDLTTKEIILYTANNPKPVIMPNLKGKTLDEIREFLSLYGITPTVLQEPVQFNNQYGSEPVVIDQRPLAGSLVTWTPEKPLPVQLQVR